MSSFIIANNANLLGTKLFSQLIKWPHLIEFTSCLCSNIPFVFNIQWKMPRAFMYCAGNTRKDAVKYISSFRLGVPELWNMAFSLITQIIM